MTDESQEVKIEIGEEIIEATVLGETYAIRLGSAPDWNDDQIFVQHNDGDWELLDTNIKIYEDDDADMLAVLREVIFSPEYGPYCRNIVDAVDAAIQAKRDERDGTVRTVCWEQTYAVRANWGESSDQVYGQYEYGDWTPLGMQVADYCHEPTNALRSYILDGEDANDPDVVAAVDIAIKNVVSGA